MSIEGSFLGRSATSQTTRFISRKLRELGFVLIDGREGKSADRVNGLKQSVIIAAAHSCCCSWAAPSPSSAGAGLPGETDASL